MEESGIGRRWNKNKEGKKRFEAWYDLKAQYDQRPMQRSVEIWQKNYYLGLVILAI